MKKSVHILLGFAAAISLFLLFWPFAEWSPAMSVLLRILPSAALQALLCRTCKSSWTQAIPVILTGVIAVWGTYLYFTSPHWGNATALDLTADYISPFLCCAAVLMVSMLKKKKR